MPRLRALQPRCNYNTIARGKMGQEVQEWGVLQRRPTHPEPVEGSRTAGGPKTAITVFGAELRRKTGRLLGAFFPFDFNFL